MADSRSKKQCLSINEYEVYVLDIERANLGHITSLQAEIRMLRNKLERLERLNESRSSEGMSRAA